MLQNKAISRIKILKYVALALFAIILVRLFFIQIIEHDIYLAKANKQHVSKTTIAARRGEIYMMNQGEPVAVVLNQTRYFIAIDPTVTKKEIAEEVLKVHAKDYQTNDLDKIYSTEGLRYAIIAKNMPRELAEEIIAADYSGIWIKKSNHRVYPEGELASGLLGFVNDEDEGQYGVEGSLNDILAGENGEVIAVTDINKVALSIGDINFKKAAKDGKNIVLTVDRGLERGIEEIASEVVKSTDATNVSVLVMDSTNGEVLAMANLPNYDPANYSEVTDVSKYLNYVTDVPYEPASVCKNFAYAAAINEGLMTPDTRYNNKGYEVIDGETVNNSVKQASLSGSIDMWTAFSWSLNTSSIYALKLLGGNPNEINQTGREKLHDYYYNKFRLGQKTGIEISEAEGIIQDPNEGYARNLAYATMTFGQGLDITMLQTATAFSAVINGGYYRTPTIIKGTFEKGQLIKQERENVMEDQILSTETSSMMRELLISNRKSKLRAGIDRAGYTIGGKTGTAQVVINGAYDDMDTLIGSYIGFVGGSEELPKYVIMVKMWGGKGQTFEGKDGGKVFDSISNFLIDYFKIKPKE